MTFLRLRAFTLIELLIVIAIIAVLALIAVPNFLEAQIRAQVTRVINDQRVLAQALESYRSDHGSLPYPLAPSGDGYDLAGRLTPLATPIRYLSGEMEDPFHGRYDNGAVLIDLKGRPGAQAYCYGRGDRSGIRGTLDLGEQYFMLVSAGPDRVLNQLHYYPPAHGMSGAGCPVCDPALASVLSITVYDPTNGVVSEGDIYRWITALAP